MLIIVSVLYCRLCIILFIDNPVMDMDISKRIEEIITENYVYFDNIRMAYVSIKQQATFFNSFDVDKLSTSTDGCEGVYHDKVSVESKISDLVMYTRFQLTIIQ